MPIKTNANEVFADVLATHGIKIEAFAAASGYSSSHVGRWKLAEAVIPIDAWRCLWALTQDLRVIHQVWPGAVLLQNLCPAHRQTPPKSPEEIFPPLLQLFDQHRGCVEYAYKIAKDRRVDAGDDHAINQFIKHKAEALRLLSEAEQVLLALREARTP